MAGEWRRRVAVLRADSAILCVVRLVPPRLPWICHLGLRGEPCGNFVLVAVARRITQAPRPRRPASIKRRGKGALRPPRKEVHGRGSARPMNMPAPEDPTIGARSIPGRQIQIVLFEAPTVGLEPLPSSPAICHRPVLPGPCGHASSQKRGRGEHQTFPPRGSPLPAPPRRRPLPPATASNTNSFPIRSSSPESPLNVSSP